MDVLRVLSIAENLHDAPNLYYSNNKKFVVIVAHLLPLAKIPTMGNTEVCPIAVILPERCICTTLTTKKVQ